MYSLKIIPPWKADPTLFPVPRDAYIAGTWNYAYGIDPRDHADYNKAVKRAIKQGWNPWWIRSFADVEATMQGCFFDYDSADRVIKFFRYLRHSKGRQWAGRVIELADWQRYDFILPLFGWMRHNEDYDVTDPRSLETLRRFRSAYVEVAKKNGKTTLCSGIALYLLMGDDEDGAEVYSAAVDREQAALIYQPASAMVDQSSDIKPHLHCIESTKRIVYPRTRSFYKALSSEVPSKEGFNPHAIIFDELHVYKNSGLWDTLKYGDIARTQPIQIAITTAGVYDPTSLGWQQHEYALKVRDAIADAHKDVEHFVYLCGPNKEESEEHWRDPKVWMKANPSWGITIQEREMASKCKKAERIPTDQNDFKRYRLTIWTAQKSVWIPRPKWDLCGDEFDERDMEGRTCFCGLDLSLTQDITASVLFFPRRDDSEKHAILPAFWCPKDVIQERDEESNGLYSIWEKNGYLFTTPGNIIDYDYIKCYTLSVKERFDLKSICYDKWNATQLALDLQSEGIEMIPFGQGFAAMTEPTKRMADIVASQSIIHSKNPVMDWMIGNAQSISDTNGNIRITKGEARGPGKGKVRYKVDGVIAAIMAIGGWLIRENKPSVYERRGIITV